jgi:hypothetical protein
MILSRTRCKEHDENTLDKITPLEKALTDKQDKRNLNDWPGTKKSVLI